MSVYWVVVHVFSASRSTFSLPLTSVHRVCLKKLSSIPFPFLWCFKLHGVGTPLSKKNKRELYSYVLRALRTEEQILKRTLPVTNVTLPGTMNNSTVVELSFINTKKFIR